MFPWVYRGEGNQHIVISDEKVTLEIGTTTELSILMILRYLYDMCDVDVHLTVTE